VSVATTDEQRAVQESIRSWASKTQPLAAVRSAELEQARAEDVWSEFTGLGFLAVALPEECGGVGGSMVDLAAIVEEAASAMVPGPIVGTVLAGQLLARSGAPIAQKLLPALAEGQLPCAVALDAGTLTAERARDGGILVTGTVGPVQGADDVSTLVLAARSGAEELWFVLDAGTSGVQVTQRKATDLTRTVADVRLEQVSVSADRLLGGVRSTLVLDLAATLFAAECAGVAGWCLRTAADYARVREQFGKPIGSFQAIKHLCAEMLCREAVSTAVAWDAASAAESEELPLAAAVAAAVALDAAVENAKDCIQVLGGIGFTWEHDAHFYLRRAITLRQLLGGSARWRRRAAELALQGSRRTLGIDLGAEAEAGRVEIRARAEQIASLPEEEQRQDLVDSGFFNPHWPRPHGLDAAPALQLIIDQELHRAGVSRPNIVIGGWAAPTILEHGTAELIERFVGPTLSGQVRWCQLFSEPGAGSDLASLRTKAERVDGGWRLSGQKVWTSLAKEANWAICLARTDPAAPKHKGITYFLVDMSSPGIDIRPLREITGDYLFNEVFLDDVFVPDADVVGEVNGGWKLARTTLANERVAMGGGSSLGEGVEALLTQAEQRGVTEDDGLREHIGALVSEGQAQSLLELRTALRQLGGEDPGAESSVRKLVGVRHRQALSEAALELLGPDGAESGPIVRTFLNYRSLSIAGGSTQILLTVAAERILGLPR
jgi:3-oxochol-4-en-24-oyl-CoA dehydrogenase